MKNTWEFQSNGQNILLEKVSKDLKKSFAKIIGVFSVIKETGIDLLEELLEEYIDNSKLNISIFTGYDKKNTTKIILERLMNLCKNTYLYDNNKEAGVDSNILILENENKSVVYFFSGNISEGGLKNNSNIFLRQELDLSKKTDREEYTELLSKVNKYFESSDNKLTRDVIEKLAKDKEIFTTKIYNHKPMSISELIGKNKNETKETEKMSIDEDHILNNKLIKKIDIDKLDFDIEIDDEVKSTKQEESKKKKKEKQNTKKDIVVEKAKEKISSKIKKQIAEISELENNQEDEIIKETSSMFLEEEIFDLEGLLFKKSKAGITKREIDEEIKEITKKETIKTKELKTKKEKKDNKEEQIKEEILDDKIIATKKIDLSNITNLVMQMPKQQENASTIKVPVYVRNTIPNFFKWPSTYTKNSEGEKIKSAKAEIVDVKTNKVKNKEILFSQSQGQTYMEIKVPNGQEFEIIEDDIVRIMKKDDNEYRIEIIKKDMLEYEIWAKFCTHQFKGNDKRYGIM